MSTLDLVFRRVSRLADSWPACVWPVVPRPFSAWTSRRLAWVLGLARSPAAFR